MHWVPRIALILFSVLGVSFCMPTYYAVSYTRVFPGTPTTIVVSIGPESDIPGSQDHGSLDDAEVTAPANILIDDSIHRAINSGPSPTFIQSDGPSSLPIVTHSGGLRSLPRSSSPAETRSRSQAGGSTSFASDSTESNSSMPSAMPGRIPATPTTMASSFLTPATQSPSFTTQASVREGHSSASSVSTQPPLTPLATRSRVLAGLGAPAAGGIAAGVVALLAVLAAIWRQHRRRRAALSGESAADDPTAYALFPDVQSDPESPKDIKPLYPATPDASSPEAEGSTAEGCVVFAEEVGRALARAGLSQRALLNSLNRLHENRTRIVSEHGSEASPPQYTA